MFRRYEKVKSSMNSDGNFKKDTTYYREIPLRENDIYVLSQFGDRFDSLSNQFYGTPHYWWYIAKANDMNFNNIPEGTQIRIPATPEFAGVRNDI
tara:strand:- start:107 stop:391 length:285 start_codon:yes stop_codon:yes gene_type:complete